VFVHRTGRGCSIFKASWIEALGCRTRIAGRRQRWGEMGDGNLAVRDGILRRDSWNRAWDFGVRDGILQFRLE
jgi:hypothetical protein